MELRYNRLKMLGFGLIFACLGAIAIVITATLDAQSDLRVARVLISVMGVRAAQAVLIGLGLLVIGIGIRALSLAGKNGRAARIAENGIAVRSVFYAGLLEWSAVRSIGIGPMPLVPGKRALVFTPRDRFGWWLKPLTLSDNITISLEMLEIENGELDDWLVNTVKRPAKPVRKRFSAPGRGIQARGRGFGRKA